MLAFVSRAECRPPAKVPQYRPVAFSWQIFVEGVERRKNDFAKQRIGLDASKLEILDMMMDEPRKDVLLRKLRREPMSKEYIEAIEKAYQMTPSYNRFKNPIWYTDGLDSKHNKKGFF